MELSSDYPREYFKSVQLQQEASTASHLAASVLQAAWRLRRTTVAVQQRNPLRAPIDGIISPFVPIGSSCTVVEDSAKIHLSTTTKRHAKYEAESLGTTSDNSSRRYSEREDQAGNLDVGISSRLWRVAVQKVQSWWRKYYRSRQSHKRQLLPHDDVLQQPTRSLSGGMILAKPVILHSSLSSASARQEEHQVMHGDPHRPTSSSSQPPPPSLRRLTKKGIKRCRAATSALPTMATLWLRESETAALLDALGLPLDPVCNIDLRERVSESTVCLQLLGSGSTDGRTYRTISSSPSSPVSKTSVDGIVGEGGHKGEGREISAATEECSILMAKSLSAVAARLSLLPREALPFGSRHGRVALDYLARLIHGPQGGLRVQRLLLSWCDLKVIEWNASQVQEFLAAVGVPEDANTQDLAPASGFDLLQQTLAAITIPDMATGEELFDTDGLRNGIGYMREGKHRNVTKAQSALVATDNQSLHQGLLGSGTKPSVLRKRILFHCATVSWAAVWQETGALPGPNGRATVAAIAGSAQTLDVALRHVLSQELHRRAAERLAGIRSRDGLFLSPVTSTENQPSFNMLNVRPPCTPRKSVKDESCTDGSGGSGEVPGGKHQTASARNRNEGNAQSPVARDLRPTAPAAPVTTTVSTTSSTKHRMEIPDHMTVSGNGGTKSGVTRRHESRKGSSVFGNEDLLSVQSRTTDTRAQYANYSSYTKNGHSSSSSSSSSSSPSSPSSASKTTKHIARHHKQGGYLTSRPTGLPRVANVVTADASLNSASRVLRSTTSEQRVVTSFDNGESPRGKSTTMEAMRARQARPLYREDATLEQEVASSGGGRYGEGRVLAGRTMYHRWANGRAQSTEPAAATQTDTLSTTAVVQPDSVSPRNSQPRTVGFARRNEIYGKEDPASWMLPRADGNRRNGAASTPVATNKVNSARCAHRLRGDLKLRAATIYFDEHPPLPTNRGRGNMTVGHARRQIATPAPWRPAGISLSAPPPPPPPAATGFRDEERKRHDSDIDMFSHDRKVPSATNRLARPRSSARHERRDAGVSRRPARGRRRQHMVKAISGRGSSVSASEAGSAWSRIRKRSARATRHQDSDNEGEEKIRGSLSDHEGRQAWNQRITAWQASPPRYDDSALLTPCGDTGSMVQSSAAYDAVMTGGFWDESIDHDLDIAKNRAHIGEIAPANTEPETGRSTQLSENLLRGYAEKQSEITRTPGEVTVDRLWNNIKSPISLDSRQQRVTDATREMVDHDGSARRETELRSSSTPSAHFRDGTAHSLSREARRMLAAAAAERRAVNATSNNTRPGIIEDSSTIGGQDPSIRSGTAPSHAPATTNPLLAQGERRGGKAVSENLNEVGHSMVWGRPSVEESSRSIYRTPGHGHVAVGLSRESELGRAMAVERGRKGGRASWESRDALFPIEIAWDDTDASEGALKPQPSAVDDAKAWIDKVKAGLCW